MSKYQIKINVQCGEVFLIVWGTEIQIIILFYDDSNGVKINPYKNSQSLNITGALYYKSL